MLQVSTLGNALIAAGQHRVLPSSSRAFATLLYLASEPGRRFPRAGLQSMIFPDQSESNGSHSLRQLVYKLRQSGAPIESNAGSVWVDADHVRRDYAEVISSESLSADQLASIEGGFLPGYNPTKNGGFAEWLESYRTRATLELRRAVLRALTRARTVGDWKTVEQAARACLALDPLNEEATLALAEAVALAGSKAAAVRLLDDYLKEIGAGSLDLRVPATVLRRRISERIPESSFRSRPELPFVGRSSEMTTLAEKFQLARRGQGQCVVISGEPGIGKTRLAAEFTTIAALDGARIERAMAQPHDVQRPLGAFVELVPRLMQLPGALGCSPESMAALKRLITGNPHPHSHPAELGAALDSESIFYGITRAINDLVSALCSETLLVLLFEDTHWLDSLSIRVIGDLISSRSRQRPFVVVTSRDATPLPEGPRTSGDVTRLHLQGIDHEAATRLVTLAVGRPVEDATLTSWMVSVTFGNPLFIGAVAEHYVATGERFSVPPTLRSLFAERLRTIDRRTFALVQMCAVLGKFCTIPRLISALEMGHVDLLEAVQEAETARLVVADGTSVSVSHSLMRDAILEQSAALALRFAHRRAAAVLEAEMLAAPAAAGLWELAEHLVLAAEYESAVAAFRACATHAHEIGRPREAALALRRAIDLPLSATARAIIGRDLLLTAVAGSEYELAQEGLVTWRSADPSVIHDSAEIAELRTRTILSEGADGIQERLIDCAGSADAPADHRIEAGAMAVIVAQNSCRPELADQVSKLLSEVISELQGDAGCDEFLMIYHSAFGDLDEAAAAARRLAGVAHTRSPAKEARDLLNASRAFWLAGSVHEALRSLERCYSVSSQYGLTRMAFHAAVRLASFLLDVDVEPTSRAREWLELGEALAENAQGLNATYEYRNVRSQFAFALGNVDEGRNYYVANHLPTTTEIGRRWSRAIAMRTRQLEGDPALHDVELGTYIVAATQLPRQEVADTEIAIVIQSLVARQRHAEADSALNDYLSRTRLLRNPLDLLLTRTARDFQRNP